MSENVNIKSDNKKASVKFYLVLLLCGMAGGIIGFSMIYFQKNISTVSEAFTKVMQAKAFNIALPMTIVMILVTVIYVIWIFAYTKREKGNIEICIKADDGENLEMLDKKMSYCLWASNGLMILHYFSFSVVIFIAKKFISDNMQLAVLLFASAIVIIVGSLLLLKTQQKTMDLVRMMHPEKKGSIYDFKFNKKWENSCDEAELIQIYRAGYRAYQVVNILCIILWSIFMLFGIGTGIGFLPAVSILIIWTAATFVYNYYSMK